LQLRSALKDHPHLRPCLKRCGHCRILFLTHPRNAGRHDLRCPFGCREAHRKKSSNKRSVEYYQTEQGKEKKKTINDRRKKSNGVMEKTRTSEKSEIDPPALSHIRMITVMIEDRDVAPTEIFSMLESMLRQHSMDSRKKSVYGYPYRWKQPP